MTVSPLTGQRHRQVAVPGGSGGPWPVFAQLLGGGELSVLASGGGPLGWVEYSSPPRRPADGSCWTTGRRPRAVAGD